MINELIYILPDHVGGVASVIGNLLKYSKSDLKKTVLLLRTSHDGNISYRFDCDNQQVINIDPHQSLSSVYKEICRYVSPNSVIISNDGWFEIDALAYCNKSNPLVYILHGNFDHYYQQISKHSNRISKVITVSSYLKSQAMRYFDGGVEFIRFPISNTESFNDQKYNGEQIIINYAGRLEVAKGTQHFPLLVSKLNGLGINFRFNIFGAGEDYDILMSALGKYTNIHIYGQRSHEEIIKSNSTAHINLLFSQTEGLPVCVVEAMKSGMVPIVFELPSGIPDIIQDKVNGFILPQGNISDVVRIIDKLYKDRKYMKDIATSAMRFAQKEFDPYEQTRKYESTFLTLETSMVKFNPLKRLLLHLPAPTYYSFKGYKKKLTSFFK